MPVVQITLVQGRDEQKIQKCIRAVARAVSEQLEAPIDTVRVMVTEVPPTRFSVGERLKSDASPSK